MSRRKQEGHGPQTATVVKHIPQGENIEHNHRVSVEDTQHSTERKVKHEQVTRRCRKRQMDTGETSTTQQHWQIAQQPFFENDSQQEASNMYNTQKAKKTYFSELSEAGEEERSSRERDYTDDSRTSPDFIEYFRKSRCARPKPDPDVYNWPKEWLPKPDTPLVPAHTSALKIDPPKSKPPVHVFENTFYLQSPPKMRSELEPWKAEFDYNPEVEMARLKKIKKTEKQLMDTVSEHRRTHTEKLDIKKDAERIVDIQEYMEKTAKYNERKIKDMEILRKVYRERDVGEPPDTNDIVEMAMDLKHKVYLKSMKKSYPGYIHTKRNTTDHGDIDFDFTIPNEDTITDASRKITNTIFQKRESALEKDLGVVIHEPEPGPSAGVNYVYESYKKARANMLTHDSYSKRGWAPNCVRTDEGMSAVQQPQAVGRGQDQRMTLWYGHEKHRMLEQYKRNTCDESKAGSSKSSGLNHANEGGSMHGHNDNKEGEDGEKLKEEDPFQPRVRLWYGHGQSKGDDEDEAIRTMFGGSQKRTFDDYCDEDNAYGEECHNVKHRSRLWYGQDELMVTDELERDDKLNHDELRVRKEDTTVKDEEDVEVTFTRTVPFLYLSTEDLPHRIRTETYTYKRTPHQSTDTNSQDLHIGRCIIL